MIPIFSILTRHTKTVHIPFDTIPPSLPQMSPLSGPLSLHLHTSHGPACITVTFNTLLWSTRPNHCNLILLTDKLTWSSPSHSIASIFSLLSIILKPHIQPSSFLKITIYPYYIKLIWTIFKRSKKQWNKLTIHRFNQTHSFLALPDIHKDECCLLLCVLILISSM